MPAPRRSWTDRIHGLLRVDELVVLLAEEHQVRVAVAVGVVDLRQTTRAVASLSDDVRDLAEHDDFARRRVYDRQQSSTSLEGATVA